ncbi:arsenate reductase ArsC [Candidatus Fermentibacterales bacterium]|nr:arsenate reductase ArsC [Candidatus Fermentibacterales bacterium]
MDRPRVLFLCTGNSCRSQMAEGWARKLRGDRLEPFSAGIRADGMNPLTIEVMREAGVDISGQWSKSVGEVADLGFDYVVTLCGSARESCPVFPGTTVVLHRGFEDPVDLLREDMSWEEKLQVYRGTRDAIGEFVLELPDWLTDSGDSRTVLHLPEDGGVLPG